jgi:hypothetical protein
MNLLRLEEDPGRQIRSLQGLCIHRKIKRYKRAHIYGRSGSEPTITVFEYYITCLIPRSHCDLKIFTKLSL